MSDCKEKGIIFSDFAFGKWSYSSNTVNGGAIVNAVEGTGGKRFEVSGRPVSAQSSHGVDAIFNHILGSVADPQNEFKAVIAAGWKTITLDKPLNSYNKADTDRDELPDWDEVYTGNSINGFELSADGTYIKVYRQFRTELIL